MQPQTTTLKSGGFFIPLPHGKRKPNLWHPGDH